jgi:hypothetical protein
MRLKLDSLVDDHVVEHGHAFQMMVIGAIVPE